MSVFLDTNILLYAAMPTLAESDKFQTASSLLDCPDNMLSVQVLNEFINQATHPKRVERMDRRDAFAFARTLRAFRIQPLDLAVFDTAADLSLRTNYNWWDCLIVAAAITLGCETLATEDMRHGHIIDGVRIENPFRDLA